MFSRNSSVTALRVLVPAAFIACALAVFFSWVWGFETTSDRTEWSPAQYRTAAAFTDRASKKFVANDGGVIWKVTRSDGYTFYVEESDKLPAWAAAPHELLSDEREAVLSLHLVAIPWWMPGEGEIKYSWATLIAIITVFTLLSAAAFIFFLGRNQYIRNKGDVNTAAMFITTFGTGVVAAFFVLWLQHQSLPYLPARALLLPAYLGGSLIAGMFVNSFLVRRAKRMRMRS